MEDVANVFSPILSNPFEGVFNIAGDEVLSTSELVKMMAEISGKTANISYVDTKNEGDLIADNHKMKEIFRSFSAGFTETGAIRNVWFQFIAGVLEAYGENSSPPLPGYSAVETLKALPAPSVNWGWIVGQLHYARQYFPILLTKSFSVLWIME